MSTLVVLPVLVPLLTAAISMATAPWRMVQRTLGVLGTGALMVIGARLLWQVRDGTILVQNMGAWPAPFGIVFVADVLAGLLVLVAGIIGFATAVYSLGDLDAPRERWGYYPLLHVLLAGVCGAFLTGDLFNLFVWFEVLLIASFVLLALGGTQGQMEGAIKYVVINLVSSALFLSAVGILYGLVGTVNMADLAVKLADTGRPGLVTTVAMMFLVAFGIKAAVFPLFFWLPASYHTPPAAVSALFAGLLTKVGVYALIRTFTLIFTQDVGFTHTVLLVIGVATMVSGGVSALAPGDMRRMLSFQVIAAIGFMVVGLGIYTPLAIAGALFYLAHDIIVKANLFFVSGLAYRLHGTFRLERLGGIARHHPWIAILFLVPALSLAGVPPLSGFWAKLLIIVAGLEAGQAFVVAVALAVGLLTLLNMIKIWGEAFWKARPEDTPVLTVPRGRWAAMVAPVAFLALITIFIGLFPSHLFELADTAGRQLMQRDDYLEAVLGVVP